jgi:hypothetical protein
MARTRLQDLAREFTPEELTAFYGGTGHICDELCHHAGETHGNWQEAGGLGKGHNPGEGDPYGGFGWEEGGGTGYY